MKSWRKYRRSSRSLKTLTACRAQICPGSSGLPWANSRTILSCPSSGRWPLSGRRTELPTQTLRSRAILGTFCGLWVMVLLDSSPRELHYALSPPTFARWLLPKSSGACRRIKQTKRHYWHCLSIQVSHLPEQTMLTLLSPLPSMHHALMSADAILFPLR